MTPEVYKFLETLLAKLGTGINHWRFCIVVGAMGENYLLRVFDQNGRQIGEDYYGVTIKDCVDQFNLPESFSLPLFNPETK